MYIHVGIVLFAALYNIEGSEDAIMSVVIFIMIVANNAFGIV